MNMFDQDALESFLKGERDDLTYYIRKYQPDSTIPPPPYHTELAHIHESHFNRIQPPLCYTLPLLSGHETTNTRMNPVILTE